MPVFKASRNFQGGTVVNGYDYATHDSGGTTAFFTAVKNVVIDTTDLAPDVAVVALQWGVAQGCQVTNVRIHMPMNSKGHTGIALDQGSTTIVSDVVSYNCLGGRWRVGLADCCRRSLGVRLGSGIRISRLVSSRSRFRNARLGCRSRMGSWR